ncbi:pyrimidine/purine nucleoside phosphorylase [Litoricolaceae bacterium]|nr:pyrimidine/purine nucleoside phosphorylase [Litorivicinaceae bacterium]
MQVNRYFDDQVLSIGFDNSNGESSFGVMAPGSYEFSTSKNERMVVISGALVVQRHDDPEPLLYSDGEEFHVPADQTFAVEVTEPTAYLCEYS